MAFTSIYDKLVLESKCVFTPPKDTIDLYILAGQSNAHGQGESGTSDVGLNAFIQAVRNLMRTKYEIRNPTTFPVVITGNSTNWGSTLEAGVAFPDPYIGFVDAAQYGQIDIDGTFNVHIGSGTDFDVTGNGVNDMFDIGEEYANQMFLAQTGSTPTG